MRFISIMYESVLLRLERALGVANWSCSNDKKLACTRPLVRRRPFPRRPCLIYPRSLISRLAAGIQRPIVFSSLQQWSASFQNYLAITTIVFDMLIHIHYHDALYRTSQFLNSINQLFFFKKNFKKFLFFKIMKLKMIDTFSKAFLVGWFLFFFCFVMVFLRNFFFLNRIDS